VRPITSLQFNDAVNAAILAMDGKISRDNARLVTLAVGEAFGLTIPLKSQSRPGNPLAHQTEGLNSLERV
jgi:hypothetical protein